MLVSGVLVLPRFFRSQILVKKQPCWAWYLYCTLFQVCQSTLLFSLTLMHRYINGDYWVDFWISTVRLQIKGTNKNRYRYLHLGLDFQELHKAELAASRLKVCSIVDSQSFCPFCCCSLKNTFRWCSQRCKNHRNFVSCKPFHKGECFPLCALIFAGQAQVTESINACMASCSPET